MEDNYSRAWMAAVFLSVILFGLTSVIHSYGYNDDYHVLYDILTGRFSSLSHVLTRDGRFLTAVFVQAGFSMLDTVGDLRFVRAAGLLVTGVAAASYFLIIRTAGFKNPFAASLAIVTFTTPALAVYNSWAICFPYPLGALAGLVSGLFIYQGTTISRLDPRRRTLFLVAGILLAILCYWIYQPIAFFSLLAGSVLAWREICTSRKGAIRGLLLVSIFVACAGLYVLFNNQLTQMLGMPPSGRTEWAPDFIGRLHYIASHTLPASSSGWLSLFSPLVAKVTSAIIAVIILLSFIIEGSTRFALRATFGIVILFLSIFTYSVLKEAYLAYRLYAGPTAWVLFLLWWAVSSMWEKWQLHGCRLFHRVSLSIAGLLLGLWLLAYLVIPSRYLQELNAKEYAAIVKSANTELTAVPEALDIVLPAPYERTMKDVFWAEFKTRSSHMPWVAPKMVSLAVGEALGETVRDSQHNPLSVFYAASRINPGERSSLDVFDLVHSGNWSWVQHPFFGRCRKVDHLEFYHSPVFGVFDNAEYPYIYHLGLGWIYAVRPDESIAVLLEHGSKECRFEETSFPVLKIEGQPPLLYDPFIGYRARLLPIDKP